MTRALYLALACCGVACQPAPRAAATPAATQLIVNARLIDGTGTPARTASVRIEADRIVEVGDLAPSAGEATIGAAGLVLAPGFIDTHSHADDQIAEHPDALAAVSQGITTVIGGQDGGSNYPLAEFFARFERAPGAVNIASYAGHGTIRRRVLGERYQRAATPEELERMKAMLRQELEAGALGLGTGLEYDPGIYSSREEVLELAKVAAAARSRYISHLRSEDRYFWEAVDEIIAIGRGAKLPVQISHIKLAMISDWGKTDRLLTMLDQARASGVDITADIYPYTYWQSTMTVLFPKRDFENRETAAFILKEIVPPDGFLVGTYKPEPAYAGRTLTEISKLRRTEPVTTLIDLIRDAEAWQAKTGEGAESMIGTSMTEDDVERLMRWPHTNICTDGELDGAHPRGFGTYPRVLGRYIRERKVMSLEEGIRRMTSLAARHAGIADRGRIAPGMSADLVLFDPESVIDRATTADPKAVSAGIRKVWTNGVLVYDNGRVTGARPGRVVRRAR